MQKVAINPEYDTIITSHKQVNDHIQASFTQFLQKWENDIGERKYIKRAEELLSHSRHIMVVNSYDFHNYDELLAATVMGEYSRYEAVLNRALTVFMHQIEKNFDNFNNEEWINSKKSKEDE